jgi:hypothetical protein
MVDGRSDSLDLDDAFLALMVGCLSISLDLVMVFTLLLSFYSNQVLLCYELGGKYKGIHPHHSIHHFIASSHSLY